MCRDELILFQIMFVTVDTDEDDHRRVIEFLGLKGEPLPTMRIIQVMLPFQRNDLFFKKQMFGKVFKLLTYQRLVPATSCAFLAFSKDFVALVS